MNYFDVVKKENIGKSYEMFIDGVSKGVWELKNGFGIEEFDFYRDGEPLTEIYFSSQIARMRFKEVVDWSKVPVDTKVLVSDNKLDWEPGHFALYKNGIFYTWEFGKSSFTVCEKTEAYMANWEYCKLYEE